MSELKNARFPAEEPEFGDSDYQGTDSYKSLDGKSISGISIEDEIFDQGNPGDAKRIQEESEKSGEDPTGKNLATRRNGGK
jgi:hypothetical protein